MRQIILNIIILFISWLILSLAFYKNELSSDAFLKFGFPLVVYSDFNGKGKIEVLNLGLHIFNLAVTLSIIIFTGCTPTILRKLKKID